MDRNPTDGELLAASRSRPELFETVFERHYSKVVRFAAGRVGADEAPDVASDTFVRAFDRRSRFDESRDSALPWLFGIAANVMRERHRRLHRRHRALQRLSPGASLDLTRFETDAVERLDAQSQSPALNAALARLSEDEYQVLMLAALAQFSYQDIADFLDVPIGTVRSRLSRAKRRVREHLEADRPIPGGVDARSQRVL